MKPTYIVVLVLLVIGVGLLATQASWLPAVTALFTLPTETPDDDPIVPVTTDIDMTKWNWVLSTTSPQGTQFSYPSPLPTTFVRALSWPPKVSITAGAFTCVEVATTTADGLPIQSERRTVGSHTYCVGTASEGAAGTTYTTYEYAIAQGDFVATASFVLGTPQCMNYDEPEQSACAREQKSFNVDALADRIITSIRML